MHSRAARSVSIPLDTHSANAGDGIQPNCSQPVVDEDDDLPRPSLESRWIALVILIGLTVINVRLQSLEINISMS